MSGENRGGGGGGGGGEQERAKAVACLWCGVGFLAAHSKMTALGYFKYNGLSLRNILLKMQTKTVYMHFHAYP